MSSCRLIYKSIAYSMATNDAALTELEHQAAYNNKKFEICGILFFSDDRFLQVLEGDPKYVRRLYLNIIKDERHHDVELITYTEITKPEFTDWSMNLVDLNNLDSKYRELLEQNTQLMITQKYKEAMQAHREIKEVLEKMKTSMESNLFKVAQSN